MGKWISRVKENLVQTPSFNADNVDTVRSKPNNNPSMSTLSVPTLPKIVKNLVTTVTPIKNLNGMCPDNCGYMLPFCNCLHGATHE